MFFCNDSYIFLTGSLHFSKSQEPIAYLKIKKIGHVYITKTEGKIFHGFNSRMVDDHANVS